MKELRYILTLLAGLSCFSCQRALDTKPTDFITPETYYKTAEQLQTALNGVYRSLTGAGVYGNNYLYMFNINTDESYGRAIELTPSYQYDAADAKNELFWKGLYEGIQRANLLLASIEGVEMDGTKKNVIKGEALFLRSYMYFLLVSNYGDVPLITAPTASILNVNMARTPMKRVYEQVTADMISAEELLKTQTVTSLGYGGKISRTAVQGLLARVYLYMAGFPLNDVAKYNDALLWAQKVVNPPGTAPEHALNPDYRDIFIKYATDKYDVKESIWELEFWGNRTGGVDLTCSYTGRFCGIRCSDQEKGASVGYVVATRKLYDSYEINPSSTTTPNKASYDLRRDWNCASYYWGIGTTAVYTPINSKWDMNAGKWRREYETVLPKDKNFTPQNFPVLRYADVLLMLAEAENEINGPTTVAQNAINQVRRRAYGLMLPQPPVPGVNADVPANISQEEFRQFIKDERARELCFEALRRNDLIRWGNFVGDMKAFLAYANANGGTLTTITTPASRVSSRNIYLPIPIHDMMLNKELVQNPGY